ncbi:MAG: DNA topoisomerase I [Thermoplasmatota archaeon]
MKATIGPPTGVHMHLVICEKDNAAKRISSILSGNKVRTERSGRVSIYSFMWQGRETKCLGLRGHILNMDFPRSFNSWSGTEPRELVRVEPVKTVSEKSIAKVLKGLSGEVSVVTVATDYDREGELIGREAVQYAFGEEAVDAVLRTHFSSLTTEEVLASFSSPVKIDTALANAAETRQIVDLVWGATLTRFISIASDRLGHEFLSVGRVQSPTLALIVNKEKEIKAFVPEPYFRIEALFEKERRSFSGYHSKGDIKDEGEAEGIFAVVKDVERALITDINRKERKDPPPPPFNTTQFIKAANNYGLSAARIMSIAEDLYTNGYISYPRTDNTVYPKGLDLKHTVETLDHGPYSEACSHILAKQRIVPTKGKKETTDHPPIYPTAYATKSELGPEKFRIYDLVVRRFLATLHDPSRVQLTNVKLDVAGEPFSASGLVILEEGWRSIYDLSKVKEADLPPLEVGTEVSITSMELLRKETKPPKRYSQGGLIQEMERLGLGTKSTRHEIIQKLYNRRYIEESPPVPTLSGEALIEALERHARMITEHHMTSKLEEDMELISLSKLTQEAVIEESREMLDQVLSELERHKVAIGDEISSALRVQDIVGKCPRCSNDLVMVRSKRGKKYVRCSMFPGCSKSYPLPQRGKVGWTKDVCPHCRSPMITLYKRGSRPFDVCLNPVCPSKSQRGGKDNDAGP